MDNLLKDRLDEAWKLYNLCKFKEAIDLFTHISDEFHDPSSYRGLGWSYFKLNQFPSSISAFTKSLQIKVHWDSYHGLGWAYYRSHNYKAAVLALTNSTHLHDDCDSYQALGWSLLKIGEPQSSISAFKKAIDLKQDWNSYLGLGNAYFSREYFTDSISCFLRSIELKEDWNAYRGLGWSYLRMNELENAIKMLDHSLSLKEDSNTYLGLALAYVELFYFDIALHNFILSWQMDKDPQLFKSIYSCFRNLYPAEIMIFNHFSELTKHSFLNSTTLVRPSVNKPDISEFYKQLNNGCINPYLLSLLSIYINTISEGFKYEQYHDAEQYNYDQQLNQVVDRKTVSQIFNNINILSFGDSHVKIFDCIDGITNFPFKSGTAYNLNNSSSSSGTFRSVMNSLQKYSPNDTSIILTYGEIDLRVHIAKQSRARNILPELIVKDIVKNYINFVDRLLLQGYSVFINLPHSGGSETASSISMEARNDLCRFMNNLMFRMCKTRGIKCSSLHNIVVDKITRQSRYQYFIDDFHLLQPYTKTGKFLQDQLILGFNNESVRENSNIDIYNYQKFVCKVLASTFIGIEATGTFLTGNRLKPNRANYKYDLNYILFQLPFPVLVDKIALKLTNCLNLTRQDISCYAIYSSCNPWIKLDKNVVKGSLLDTKISKEMLIYFDFSNSVYTDRHCNYIFLSLNNSSRANIENIFISRLRYRKSIYP